MSNLLNCFHCVCLTFSLLLKEMKIVEVKDWSCLDFKFSNAVHLGNLKRIENIFLEMFLNLLLFKPKKIFE